MPRVYTYKTQARRGDKAPHTCVKCHKPIEPGQDRYEWSFRYGGTRRQHVSCGYPRRSQLTQSKMGAVYDVIDGDWGTTQEDVKTNLEMAAETVREVASEYDEAAQSFGGQGENAERASELDSYAGTLDDASREVEDAEKEEGEDDEAFIARLHEIAENAASECPY